MNSVACCMPHAACVLRAAWYMHVQHTSTQYAACQKIQCMYALVYCLQAEGPAPPLGSVWVKLADKKGKVCPPPVSRYEVRWVICPSGRRTIGMPRATRPRVHTLALCARELRRMLHAGSCTLHVACCVVVHACANAPAANAARIVGSGSKAKTEDTSAASKTTAGPTIWRVRVSPRHAACLVACCRHA